MKITVTHYWDGDDDCNRYTYVTNVDGKEILLAACVLSGGLAEANIEKRARKLFGDDVEIEYAF